MPEPYESLRTDLQSIVIDPLRSRYYKEYMQSILMAMAEGVNVVGTLAWSVFDNFGSSSPQSNPVQVVSSPSGTDLIRGALFERGDFSNANVKQNGITGTLVALVCR